MEPTRIYVATTAGPSEVLDLTEEDPEVHSVICLGGSEVDLPISPSYHRFVRQPTGVIERHFHHPTWRMDVSDRIDAGGSWKLGVLIAHALADQDCLARRSHGDPAPLAWLTGDVSRDLTVEAVGHLPEKLLLSRQLFARQRDNGQAIAIFMPQADLAALDAQDLTSAGLTSDDVTGVVHANDVLAALGLPALETRKETIPTKRTALTQSTFGPPLDFAPLVMEKSRDFEGRAWFIDEITEWRDDRPGERGILILGEPGTGKSALAARLIGDDTTGRLSRDSGPAAYHFCQAATPVTTDTGQFIRSIASMVAQSRPDIAEALQDEGPAAFLTPEACRDDPSSALDFGLLPVLARVDTGPTPNVIIVDALDESFSGQGIVSIAELLAQRIDRFPPGWRLVMTGRPDPRLMRLFGSLRALRLDPQDTRNLEDLAAYVRRRLAAGSASGEIDALSRTICDASDGNFLYAQQVLDARARGVELVVVGDGLPQGLEGLYESFFSRLWPDGASYDHVARVLSVLLAALEPLTASQLFRIFALSNSAPPVAALEALGPFLRDRDRTLSIFHTSLSEWLSTDQRSSGRFWVDTEIGNKMLLDFCRQWRDVDDPYALRHIASHLARSGQPEELRDLLTSGDFLATKIDRLGSRFDVQSDFEELVGALLSQDRDDALPEVAMAETVQPGTAVVAAVLASGTNHQRACRIADMLFHAKAPAGDAAIGQLRMLNGQRSSIWLAQRLGHVELLKRAADCKSAAVRAAVVPHLYRLWLESPDTGWSLLEELGERIFGPTGLPRPRMLEVVGGVSLAMVSQHLDDRQAMARLRDLWRGWARDARDRPLTKLVGRRWTMSLIVPSLRLLLAQQPDYQPLNIKEMGAATELATTHKDARAAVIDCLDDASQTSGTIADVLADRSMPFDVILMLAAERALIVQGHRDLSGAMTALEQIHENGAPWFRQSVLYSGFHILRVAGPEGAAWLDRYMAMSRQTILGGRALFSTNSGTYRLVPHMAWTEVLADASGKQAEPGRMPALMSAALESGDAAFCERIVAASEVLSLGYHRHERALEVLRPVVGTTDAKLVEPMVGALANIRFHAETPVDAFLQSVGDDQLTQRVHAAAPTVKASDFPTWIDDMVIRLLVDRPDFRLEVVQALRRSADATSLREMLGQIVTWVVDLVAE
ncbi:MAG: NACHT domain-containing protein [Pseudomonadota bacterium]